MIIKTGRELGYSGKKAYKKFVYNLCPVCQEGKWTVDFLYRQKGSTLCKVCNGKKMGKLAAKNWGKNDW